MRRLTVEHLRPELCRRSAGMRRRTRKTTADYSAASRRRRSPAARQWLTENRAHTSVMARAATQAARQMESRSDEGAERAPFAPRPLLRKPVLHEVLLRTAIPRRSRKSQSPHFEPYHTQA